MRTFTKEWLLAAKDDLLTIEEIKKAYHDLLSAQILYEANHFN